MAPLLQFKAGKAYRRGETNWVDPSPNRGLVYLQIEDELLHFYYKDLVTQVTEDLVMFPGDASFTKGPASAGRVHVLKFHSSAERHFFWHQDIDPSKDDDLARQVNQLIGNDEQANTGEEQMEVEAPEPVASTSTTSTTATGDAPSGGASKIGSAAQMKQLADILAGLGGGASAGASGSGFANTTPEFLLPDVLPSSLLTPLLTPSLVARLTPFLPSEVTQDATSLQRAIESPEFKRSVASLDRALRTGALGPLVAGLGLGEESAMGVEAFLEGVQKQADEEVKKEGGGDGMQED